MPYIVTVESPFCCRALEQNSPMDQTFAGGKDHLQGFFLAWGDHAAKLHVHAHPYKWLKNKIVPFTICHIHVLHWTDSLKSLGQRCIQGSSFPCTLTPRHWINQIHSQILNSFSSNVPVVHLPVPTSFCLCPYSVFFISVYCGFHYLQLVLPSTPYPQSPTAWYWLRFKSNSTSGTNIWLYGYGYAFYFYHIIGPILYLCLVFVIMTNSKNIVEKLSKIATDQIKVWKIFCVEVITMLLELSFSLCGLIFGVLT